MISWFDDWETAPLSVERIRKALGALPADVEPCLMGRESITSMVCRLVESRLTDPSRRELVELIQELGRQQSAANISTGADQDTRQQRADELRDDLIRLVEDE